VFRFAVRYVFGTLAFPLADYLLFGLWCRDMQTALLAGACLMLLYALLRPLANLLLVAVHLLTLGLFSIVIDTLLILLTVRLFPQSIRVQGPEWAALAAIIINVTRGIAGKLVKA
jgi:putative membrane protein